MLRIGGVDCPAMIMQLPELAVATDYELGADSDAPRFGSETPLPAAALTPWRLQPSQARMADPAPDSRGVILGAPWPKTISDAARGTALHLAMRTCLTRPDLIEALPSATGLDAATLVMVTERAAALKAWLSDAGYTDLHCEIPVLGHSPEGAEIPGMIDLLAFGPKGCLLIDHKTGGAGAGFGPYWPQLSTYAGLIGNLYPLRPLNAIAVYWIDHGRLELAFDREAPVRAM
jgi:ATP-dependent helicase/nuclease subunit A